jgi:glycosyltransferase involved in cell wall biosynthesis
MALGTVPVASRSGGVLEILKGTRAAEFIFQLNNIENIINKLEILTLMNKSEVVTLGNELREKVKLFSSDTLNYMIS